MALYKLMMTMTINYYYYLIIILSTKPNALLSFFATGRSMVASHLGNANWTTHIWWQTNWTTVNGWQESDEWTTKFNSNL